MRRILIDKWWIAGPACAAGWHGLKTEQVSFVFPLRVLALDNTTIRVWPGNLRDKDVKSVVKRHQH